MADSKAYPVYDEKYWKLESLKYTQKNEQGSGVPWANLSMDTHPAIVIQYRWVHNRRGQSDEKTVFYRVPRSHHLVTCYKHYLVPAAEREEPPSCVKMNTWWKFLALLGDDGGQSGMCSKWEIGEKIDKPNDGDYVVKAYWCWNGGDPDLLYLPCQHCGRRWVHGQCDICKAPVAHRTRSKLATQ